jgi:HPt (histidine-containing phosphotransfer) domain-containing protein
MRRRSSLPLLAVTAGLVLCVASCAGCRSRDDEASIEERLDDTGTMDVLEKAADAEYDPPEDGRLSEEQMEMYLEVQKRAAKIRGVLAQRLKERSGEDDGSGSKKKPSLTDALGAFGDVSDMVMAEQRAALELGRNPAEYLWVQGQIAEARVAGLGQQMQSGAAQAGAQLLASLEAQLESTDDEQQRERIREQIRRTRESLEETAQSDPLSPAVRHNLDLVERYRERLEAVDRETAESTS